MAKEKEIKDKIQEGTPDKNGAEATASGAGKTTAKDNLFSDEMPPSEKNPFDDQVKDKPYAAIGDNGKSATTNNGIDSTEQKQKEGQSTEFKSTPPPAEPDTPTKEKSETEIRGNAAQTVELFLRFYSKLHTFARFLGKYDEKKLSKEDIQGKIDLNREIRYEGQTIHAGEVFTTVNQQIDATIVVSEDFKRAFSPPAERICIRRGWLLGDELYVGSLLFDDITGKMGVLIGIRKSVSNIYDALVEEMAEKKREREKSTKRKDKTDESTAKKHVDEDDKTDWEDKEFNEPEEKGETPPPTA